MSEQRREKVHTHTVRPRWTWIGLVVMVAGLALVGVGIILTSWAWAIAGLVLLVCGGLAAIYGGFFYDVQGGGSASTQLREAVEGKEFDFPDPTTKRSEDEIKQDVHRRWLSDGE